MHLDHAPIPWYRQWTARLAAKGTAAPTTLLFNLLAVVVLTLIITALGWLGSQGILPVRPGEGTAFRSSSALEITALVVLFLLQVVTSLLLPLLALIVWGRQPAVRQVLLPYVGLLLVHIFSERIFMNLFFPSMSVLIGIVYSAFRIWQARTLRNYVGTHSAPTGRALRSVTLLLTMGGYLWALNLLLLLVWRLPLVWGRA